MNRTNPKLLFLAGAMFAIVLVFKIVPTVWSTYSRLATDKENLAQELEYYRDLVESEAELKQRAEEVADLIVGIEDSVFAIPENLLGSEVQAIIRNITGRTGVEIREMRVAKIEHFEDWLKVSQELNVTINQDRILPFLNSLRAHQPRLYVSEFTVTRSRQQFIGSLTIEAFSRP